MNVEDHPLFEGWLRARSFIAAATAASAKGEGRAADANWAYERLEAINMELSTENEQQFERAYQAWRNPLTGS